MSEATVALLEGPAAPRPPRVRAVEAVYYAFILAIPFETVLYVQSDQSDPNSGISASRIVGLLLLGVALVDWRRCFRELPAAFWFICAYLAAFVVGQLSIPADVYSRFYMREFTMIQMAALFLVTYNLMRDADFRRRALGFYGWIMALSALAMLLGIFGVQFGTDDTEQRVSLLTQDPNITAGMFGIGALCLLGHPRLLQARRSIARVILTAAAVVVIMVAILRTGSRGGLLAFGSGLLALGLCSGRATRKARLAIVLAAFGVGGALIAQEFARGTSTAARLQRTWDEGDTAGRTQIYDTAWQMFLERPWLGWGGGNNRFILGARLNFPDRDTHDVYLAVLTEVGIVGGLPFFLALLESGRRGWLAGRAGDSMLFPLVCALLVMSGSIAGYQEKIFWIVLAAAAAGGP